MGRLLSSCSEKWYCTPPPPTKASEVDPIPRMCELHKFGCGWSGIVILNIQFVEMVKFVKTTI